MRDRKNGRPQQRGWCQKPSLCPRIDFGHGGNLQNKSRGVGLQFCASWREDNHEETRPICSLGWGGFGMRHDAAFVSFVANEGAIHFGRPSWGPAGAAAIYCKECCWRRPASSAELRIGSCRLWPGTFRCSHKPCYGKVVHDPAERLPVVLDTIAGVIRLRRLHKKSIFCTKSPPLVGLYVQSP